MIRSSALLLGALTCAACASGGGPAAPGGSAPSAARAAAGLFSVDAFPSTYTPAASRPVLIRNANILTAAGPLIENGSVLMRDGQIVAVGTAAAVTVPADAQVIDAAGRWVTPGVIDTHSHLGVYSAPGIAANEDGNEMTDPVTAQVWAEHSVWPHDPQFALALAGGVTAMQILPGSGNLIGGRGVTIKNVPARTVQAMKFPGAPHGLKMACGENPKRVYGQRGRAPSTAMGNVAGFRTAWIRAQKYRDTWTRWQASGSDVATRPDRDLQLETLAAALEGEILIHNHCYRADEMAQMIDIAAEFGYSITSFHHAVESYKLRDVLARENICSSMWADWWGFKLEAYDGIRENVALVHEAGACAIVHSDDPQEMQRLNQEAGKAMAAGLQAGVRLTREDAIRWITLNPARALGIGDVTGSLEAGKNGDVVIWSRDPFSVYALADQVFIDGALLYDRHDPARQPRGDFISGSLPPEAVR
ncbi:amidohydrolase [soil metagenome]